jgi:hypothetical protein
VVQIVVNREKRGNLIIPVKQPASPSEGFPYAGASAHITRKAEYYVVHFPLEIGIFHHIQRFVIAFGQIPQIVFQVIQGSVPPGII